MLVDSLQQGGAFRHAVLSAGQIMDPDSLLALRVNGADLSLDHGYPARVIVPANPGVHNTKWVASLTFARLSMRRQLRWYGASPLHLLALLACFGLAGYAAARLVSSRPLGVAAWFLGAVVGHDLLLMPLYSLADRSVMAAIRHRDPQLPVAPWINYLRVPAALSGLLLLVWFPLILRLPSPLPRLDHAVRGPVPVALAGRDRRAVPAVRRRVRAAAARPAAGRRPPHRRATSAPVRPAAPHAGHARLPRCRCAAAGKPGSANPVSDKPGGGR